MKGCWVVVAAMALLACAGCTPEERAEIGEHEKVARPGGAELWAHNCRRCHNIPAPTSYSSDQWEVVVNHMRIRAGLTAKDARMIEEFLKAAN